MKIIHSLLVCVVLSGAVAASAAPKPQMPKGRDVVDTALSVHKFDTFLMLLRDSDLTFKLKSRGPFTVFAPTDQAFEKMPSAWLQNLRNDHARLRSFILHHVARGSYTVDRALRMHHVTALDGQRLAVRNAGGHGMIGHAAFSVSNVYTSNGILHGIDSVLTRE